MSRKLLPVVLLIIFFGTSIISNLAIDEIKRIPGKIAIIGTDYNVSTYDSTTQEHIQLTDDASQERRYQWTTWSTDNRLAFFCCDLSTAGQAYVSVDGEASPRLGYENPGSAIIFAYWSPDDCGDNCRELAMLINDISGLSVDVLTTGDTPATATIGSGGPFYFHWNPAGTQMILHRGNQNLDIYNRAQNDVSESLENSSGLFQAPAWSPVDDRILVALPGSSDATSNLVIIENGESSILVEDVPGFLSFLWSPDGQYVAYRTIDQFGYGSISVIDASTGERLSIAENNIALAFFWSPDSSKIAYVTISEETRSANTDNFTTVSQNFVQDDSPALLTWQVLDIEAQTNLSYSTFIPTYELFYLLTYFDQFAPGYRLWSPDSRYLVFPGKLAESQPESAVYVLDTKEVDAELETIADGVFAIWSFE